MPKRRTPRQRRLAEDHAHAEKRRLASEERDREAHARLIVERSGDPRFVQRVALADGGSALTWSPDGAEGRALQEALLANRRAFREKFGRDPGPDDPVLFDPDMDEATPLTDVGWEQGFAAMRQAAVDAGLDPAYIAAWQEVGYVVTEANRHLFSAAEVQGYLDAVARHSDEYDDQDDEDDEWQIADGLRAVVDEVVSSGNPTAGRRLLDALDETDDIEAAGLAASAVVAVMLGWLSGARGDVGSSVAISAVDWVGEHLGPDAREHALLLASVLDHPHAPRITVAEAIDRIGDEFVGALLWLVCGLVATAADGDSGWLTQYDVS